MRADERRLLLLEPQGGLGAVKPRGIERLFFSLTPDVGRGDLNANRGDLALQFGESRAASPSTLG
jgi:hypothetical protein